jgi:NitT/TauT family transport system substrate-binding protein
MKAWLSVAIICLSLSVAQAKAAEAVRIGILNGASSFITLIADAKGYLKEAGLAPEFIVFDSGAKMIPSLATGDLDVGIGAASSALYNAVGRGLKVKIVADALRNSPGVGQSVMVRKDLIDSGEVKSLKDLKGRTVALTAFASSEAASLAKAMQSVGLTFEDTKQLYAGFPDHVVAFQNKAIDAALTGEPFATLAAEKGVAAPLMTVGEYYPNQETSVMMFSDQLLHRKREIGVQFLRAYLRGVRAYLDGRKGSYLAGPEGEALAKLLAQRSSVKDVSLLIRMRANGIDPNGDVNLEALNNDFAFFKARKQIETDVRVSDAVDLSLVHEAAGQMTR